MSKNRIKSGLSVHCHHDILVEHCYDYDERVRAIKETKPENEQEIRLRLFKLLPQEAIDEIPKILVEAYAEMKKACAEWEKARAETKKADAEWTLSAREAWHTKWCGCKEWTGEEIVFK